MDRSKTISVLRRITESDVSAFSFHYNEFGNSTPPTPINSIHSLVVLNNSNGHIPSHYNVKRGQIRFVYRSEFEEHVIDIDLKEKERIEDISDISLDKFTAIPDLHVLCSKSFYRFMTRSDFVQLLGKAFRKYKIEWVLDNHVENMPWQILRVLGLVFKMREFSCKYSDFGYDTILVRVLADSAYYHHDKPKMFDLYAGARSYCFGRVGCFISCLEDDHKRFPEGETALGKIFDYFYESRRFVCLNFDNMPFNMNLPYASALESIPFSGRRMRENPFFGSIIEEKRWPLVEPFSSDCFLLTASELSPTQKTAAIEILKYPV